jgi:alkylation response protein AidB-like acyl-CoA dehydrogenase/predicted heme/steroid binding protein
MSKEYTADEVKQHNAEGNAWIIIDNGIYDISKFAALHPGGKGVILGVAGQDASEQFWQFHNKQILKKYEKRLRIGTVKGKAPKAQSTGQQAQREQAASQQVQEVKQTSKGSGSGGDGVKELFGELVPYGDPNWYQGFYSPYYNASHRKWRAYLREFIDEHIIPFVHDWDERGQVPKELFKNLAEQGILPVAVSHAGWPRQHTDIQPGNGIVSVDEFDAFHMQIFADEFARHGSGGTSWALFGGLSIGLPPVLHFGSKDLQSRVVPGCLNGETFICLAITEPQTGSDVANITTTAKKTEDGKHYIVNGVKKWITNGIWADYFTTAVRTGGPGHSGVSLLVIPRTEGVKTERMKCQGVWASGTTYITFENVKVPVENIIGKENEGFKAIMYNFNYERLGSIRAANRFSRVLLEESMRYAFKRKTFGKHLIEHPVIRLKLAHMARMCESTHSWVENVVYQTTKMSRAEVNATLGGSIALLKAQASITMEYCAREAAQIFGGLAYTRGGQGEKVERLYREVRAYAIPAGSEEIMLDLGVRQAMKQQQNWQKQLKSKA